MPENVAIALIGFAGVCVGGLITWLAERRKNQADITGVITEAAMKLIAPLNERIEKLEHQVKDLTVINGKLRQWAERLCCQIRELGGKPEEYDGLVMEEKEEE